MDLKLIFEKYPDALHEWDVFENILKDSYGNYFTNNPHVFSAVKYIFDSKYIIAMAEWKEIPDESAFRSLIYNVEDESMIDSSYIRKALALLLKDLKKSVPDWLNNESNEELYLNDNQYNLKNTSSYNDIKSIFIALGEGKIKTDEFKSLCNDFQFNSYTDDLTYKALFTIADAGYIPKIVKWKQYPGKKEIEKVCDYLENEYLFSTDIFENAIRKIFEILGYV